MLTLDIRTCTLSNGDQSVKLPSQAARILATLARYYPDVAARSVIVRDVWGFDEPNAADGTIAVQITRIRQAAASLGVNGLVSNLYGFGFYLNHDVTVQGGEARAMIPRHVLATVTRLLETHPSRAAADRALVALAGC